MATIAAGSGKQMRLIQFAGPIRAEWYVTPTGGGAAIGASVRIGFLVGDVNQSRVISVADLGLVNAVLAQPVTAANYLKDVNATGTLTVADKGITNANLTKSLAPP